MNFKQIKNIRYSFEDSNDYIDIEISIDGEVFFPMTLNIKNSENLHTITVNDEEIGVEQYCISNGIGKWKDPRTEDEILTQDKAEKTNKVNEDVKTLIISGFTSSALGTNHMYQSDETDQLNLIGAVTSGVAQAFKCSSNDGESWQWKMHTITQLQTVLRDGASYKNQLLENASTLKSQIQVCTTIEELEAILL